MLEGTKHVPVPGMHSVPADLLQQKLRSHAARNSLAGRAQHSFGAGSSSRPGQIRRRCSVIVAASPRKAGCNAFSQGLQKSASNDCTQLDLRCGDVRDSWCGGHAHSAAAAAGICAVHAADASSCSVEDHQSQGAAFAAGQDLALPAEGGGNGDGDLATAALRASIAAGEMQHSHTKVDTRL